MSITYRKAEKTDQQALYDLGVLLNTYNLGHDLRENLFWEGWEKDIDDETSAELKSPHNLIYLAEAEDKAAIGFILVKKCEICGHFEVDQLFVKEEFRAQKVGKGLMQLAIDEAKKAKMPIELEVYQTNTNAIKFYQKLGFKEDGILMRLDFD